MKYYHELTQEEMNGLHQQATIQDVLDNYKQPDWCMMEHALAGISGCWSLTNSSTRMKISKDYCNSCDYCSAEDSLINSVNSNKKKK